MKLAISYVYYEDLRLKPDNSKYRRVNMWRLHNGFNIEIFHVSSNFKPLLPLEYESIEKCIIKVMLWNHNPFLTHSAARTSQKSAMVPLWVFEYLGKKSPTDCVPRWSVPSKKIKKLKFQSTDWCSTKGGVPSNDEKVVLQVGNVIYGQELFPVPDAPQTQILVGTELWGLIPMNHTDKPPAKKENQQNLTLTTPLGCVR